MPLLLLHGFADGLEVRLTRGEVQVSLYVIQMWERLLTCIHMYMSLQIIIQ